MSNHQRLSKWQVRTAANAIRDAAKAAGENGISVSEAWKIAAAALKLDSIPSASRGSVAINAEVNRIDNRYIHNSFKPPSPRRKTRKRRTPNGTKNTTAASTSQTEYTFEGPIKVTVKGDGIEFTAAQAKKVTIVLSVLIAILLPLTLWALA